MTTMTITKAEQLFSEARRWTRGDQDFIEDNSEIRMRAEVNYGNGGITALTRVCSDIFYVVACHHYRLPS